MHLGPASGSKLAQMQPLHITQENVFESEVIQSIIRGTDVPLATPGYADSMKMPAVNYLGFCFWRVPLPVRLPVCKYVTVFKRGWTAHL